MRLSRPCYDKAHRCPGWAGGGWRLARMERCYGGYVTARRPWLTGLDEDYPGHPGEHRWHFGHCNRCDVNTWPYVTRWLDLGYLSWRVRRAVDDWCYDHGFDVRLR
jgi:hypothetical protein